jgi:hypothetical protein
MELTLQIRTQMQAPASADGRHPPEALQQEIKIKSIFLPLMFLPSNSKSVEDWLWQKT